MIGVDNGIPVVPEPNSDVLLWVKCGVESCTCIGSQSVLQVGTFRQKMLYMGCLFNLLI